MISVYLLLDLFILDSQISILYYKPLFLIHKPPFLIHKSRFTSAHLYSPRYSAFTVSFRMFTVRR